MDEPTVILAATGYRDAARRVLELKRMVRCCRPPDGEGPCWRTGLGEEDACANCNARKDPGNQADYATARDALRAAKRKLNRALGVYA